MKDETKTKGQLINELIELRRQVSDLKEGEAKRKRAEQALQESEKKYRTLFESSRDAIMILAPPIWLFTAGNAATIEMFRVKDEKEFTSKGPWEFSPEYQPDGQLSSKKAKENIEKAMKTGSNFFEWMYKRFNGEEFPTIVLLTRIELEGKKLLQSTARDITEQKQAEEELIKHREHLEQLVNERTAELQRVIDELKRAEEALQKSEEQLKGLLKEKEILVKEVYHRVKNNFATMSSLIYLQSKQIKDKQAHETFLHCSDRIKSMSLIHERLYQSNDLANINFAEYIKTLAVQLFRSYCTDPAKISLVTEFEEVLLGVDQAIPCGLIVNELITNSLKYAFTESWQGKGEIKLVLREKGDKKIELIVSDNGVGLPRKFDLTKSESLGLQLVNTLVDQLHGEMEIDRTKGTAFRISFPKGKG